VHEREDETFVVLQGEVRFVADHATTIATAGMTVFAPRGVPHSYEVVGTKPARLLLLLTPAGLERMFEELARLPKEPRDFAKVVGICARYGVRFV
jgi:quercetin dioxygenase-like cupin family protein